MSDTEAIQASLLLLPKARLPRGALLARRRGNCLDLLFLGFLGFPIAFLLAFGHVALPEFFDTDRMQMSLTLRPDQPCATVRALAANSHVLVVRARPASKLAAQAQGAGRVGSSALMARSSASITI